MLLHWKLLSISGLFLLGILTGWYLTKSHYVANELAQQKEILRLQNETQAQIRKVSHDYQNKTDATRKQYFVLLKRLRERMPDAADLTTRRSEATGRDGLSQQDREDIVTLMFFAQEQTDRLVACQRINNATPDSR